VAWLERRLPLLAALLRRAFRVFGVEIVKTIPAPGAFLYGFAVGDRRRIFERVLFYRSDRALPLASEVIAAVKGEARLTFANFEHDTEVQRLFGWLERYARGVDDQLVRKGRLDLNGLRSDEARGVRSVSVRNILYLGVMLEACRPGRSPSAATARLSIGWPTCWIPPAWRSTRPWPAQPKLSRSATSRRPRT
jgi:hypothetical protein